MKTCTKCKRTKAATEFYRRASTEGGLRGRCKSCDSVRMKLYYQDNRDKIRAY